MDRLLIALRYLRARPISIISMFGVLVGVGALVLVDSVMNGFLGQQQKMIRGTSADIAIRLPVTLSRSSVELEKVQETIRGTPGVAGVSLRLEAPCIYSLDGAPPASLALSGLGEYHIVQLLGIDLQEERTVTALDEYMSHWNARRPLSFAFDEGDGGPLAPPPERDQDPFWFDLQHPWWQQQLGEENVKKYRHYPLKPILFGQYLKAIMGLRVGDIFNLGTWSEPSEDGKLSERSHRFVLVGTFRTKDMEFDLTKAFVRRADLRSFAGLSAYGHEILIRTDAGAGGEEEVRDRLRAALTPLGIPAEEVETWADRKQTLLRAVENERRALLIVLFLIVVVAAFNLLVILNMMVSEKIKDIGILTALGGSAGWVSSVFLICGMVVSVVGSLLGLGTGLLLTAYINDLHDGFEALTGLSMFSKDVYVFDRIPTEVDGSRIALFVLATFVCSTLFTLLPSLRAARMHSVEALRHG